MKDWQANFLCGATFGILGALSILLFHAENTKPLSCPNCICQQTNHTEQTILLKILTLNPPTKATFPLPNIDLDVAKEIAFVIAELPCTDVNLLLALISIESNFRPEVASKKVGAIGLVQCLPRWFGFLGLHGDHTDIRTNIRCGLAVLDFYLDEFKDLRLALIAYNRGPNPVHTAIAEGQDPDNGYAESILTLKERLESYE